LDLKVTVWFKEWSGKDFLICYCSGVSQKNIRKAGASGKKTSFEIISFARHRIHASIQEGINNKIKEIKRSVFGFHDFNYF